MNGLCVQVGLYKFGNYPTPGPRQWRLRGECVELDFDCHLLLWNDRRQGVDGKGLA